MPPVARSQSNYGSAASIEPQTWMDALIMNRIGSIAPPAEMPHVVPNASPPVWSQAFFDPSDYMSPMDKMRQMLMGSYPNARRTSIEDWKGPQPRFQNDGIGNPSLGMLMP